MRAADVVVDDVPELVRLVREGGDGLTSAEVPQGEPDTAYYSYHALGGILIPESALHTSATLDGGRLAIRLGGSDEWLRAVGTRELTSSSPPGRGVLASVRRGSEELATADDCLKNAFPGPTLFGRWVRLGEPIRAGGQDFIDRLFELRPELRAVSRESGQRVEVIGLVMPEEVRQGETEDSWLFVAFSLDARGDRRDGALVRGMRASAEHLGERIPELAELRQKRAAVAGLGALGAPLVAELYRGLIGSVHVLDGDFVDPGTLVRWPYGLPVSGLPKAAVLAGVATTAYPYTAVAAFPHRIGTADRENPQQSERSVLEEWSGGADILVDATAEDDVRGVLDDLARDLEIPLVTLWSVEAFGGVVARLVPGETGCSHCLDLALSPEHGDISAPVPPTNPRFIQARGCSDPTFTAPGSDLQPLWSQAVRVIFGELCTGTEDGYPRSEDDVYVHQLRAADGSLLSPPSWTSYKLPPHPECVFCSGGA